MEAQHKDPSPMGPLMCNVEPWRPLPLIEVTPDAAASDIVAALPAMLRMAMLHIPASIKQSMQCHRSQGVSSLHRLQASKRMLNAIPVNDNFPACKQRLCALKFTFLSVTQRVLH